MDMETKKTNMIDLHCDTIGEIADPKNKGKNIHLGKNNLHIDICRLKKVGASAQMFAVYVPADDLQKYGFPPNAAYDFLKDMSERMDAEFALNSTDIALARNYDEYQKNRKEDKISAFKTIEEGSFLEGRLERLQAVYNMGFRILGLIWKPENCNGFSNSSDPVIMAKGLKPFGIEVVKKANELGMIIDVSHLSDGGFYDVCKYSSKPFMATHSNCRALADETRNMTDDMIRALANKGGVMGLNLTPDFLDVSAKGKIEFMVAHIAHIKKVGGIETSAIGTDFDGMDGDLEIDNIGDMDKLFFALSKAGFTDDEIDKIAYKNALRVIREVL